MSGVDLTGPIRPVVVVSANQTTVDLTGAPIPVAVVGSVYLGLNAIVVAPASGDTTGITDLAAINAAFTSAGNSGIVQFPPNQTYIVKNYPGESPNVTPAKIIGNGSTIKLANSQSTTTTANYIQGTDTSITVTSSSGFVQGDHVFITDGAGKFTTIGTISSIPDGTHINLTATLTASGTAGTISSGAVVERDDHCLYIPLTGSYNCEITGIVFDGNASNRTVGRQWNNQTLLEINNSSPGNYISNVHVHDNVFQNSPCDAFQANDIWNLKVNNNHFSNINGNGVHPGGSTNGYDYICTDNTFKTVYQLTAATTPTASSYGHSGQAGAMCTSSGPIRGLIKGNIVDTCKAFGFGGVVSTDTDWIISGNMFYSCDWGAFKINSTNGRVAVTGNEIYNCGHETSVVGSNLEVTQVYASAPAKVAITGNIFIDSVLYHGSDSTDVSITGNYFSVTTKTKGASIEIAALVITQASTGGADSVVSGNVFRAPRNSTESAAVSETVMDCVNFGTVNNLAFLGNNFIGGRMGITFTGANITNVAINSNTFMDQYNNDAGTNSHAIRFGNITTCAGLSISNNSMMRTASNTTGAWIGLELAAITTPKCIVISGNTIQTTVNPAGGQVGMQFNSNNGQSFLINGNYVRLNNAGSGSACTGGSFTSNCIVINNVWANSNTVSLNTATTTSANTSITV